jgi:hypothetical protein
MRISRPLAAVGVAGVLAVAAPAGFAHADSTPQPRAEGVFLYFNFNDGQQALVNPASDRCLDINAQNIAGPLTNLTNGVAYVFTRPGCNGPSFAIPKGAVTYNPFPELRSVLFPAV